MLMHRSVQKVRLGHYTDSQTGVCETRTHGAQRDCGMPLKQPLQCFKVNIQCWGNSKIEVYCPQNLRNVFHSQTMLEKNQIENMFDASIDILYLNLYK